MSTYTQIVYHLTFATKNRQNVLTAVNREHLFRYIWGIIKKNKGHFYRINGVEDHIHILTSLHQIICLADFVRNIKRKSSIWIKENKLFPSFTYWQDGYGAFTHSYKEIDPLIEYIKNQKEHHKKISFREEFMLLLKEAEIEYDDKYMF